MIGAAELFQSGPVLTRQALDCIKLKAHTTLRIVALFDLLVFRRGLYYCQIAHVHDSITKFAMPTLVKEWDGIICDINSCHTITL